MQVIKYSWYTKRENQRCVYACWKTTPNQEQIQWARLCVHVARKVVTILVSLSLTPTLFQLTGPCKGVLTKVGEEGTYSLCSGKRSQLEGVGSALHSSVRPQPPPLSAVGAGRSPDSGFRAQPSRRLRENEVAGGEESCHQKPPLDPNAQSWGVRGGGYPGACGDGPGCESPSCGCYWQPSLRRAQPAAA